jgi:hypothetical protein
VVLLDTGPLAFAAACCEIRRHRRLDCPEFIDFVLAQYVDLGVDELQQERLPTLRAIKYRSQMEGIEALGGVSKAKDAFVGFQRRLLMRE